jgi:hypothetical protein
MCFISFYSCCAFGPIFNHFNLCYPTLVMILKLSLQHWLVMLFLIKANFWNTTFLLGDTFKIKLNLLFNTNKHMVTINLNSWKTIVGILVNYWITFAHKNVMRKKKNCSFFYMNKKSSQILFILKIQNSLKSIAFLKCVLSLTYIYIYI